MIFDLVIFNNELDLLEIQLKEFQNLDVCHILVESDRTFTGLPKNLHYADNASRFFGFNIIHYPYLNTEIQPAPYLHEFAQRNYLAVALAMLEPKDTDIVILRDADEIVRASSVVNFTQNGLCSLVMDDHAYYLNTRYSSQTWTHTKIMRYWNFKNSKPQTLRIMNPEMKIEHAGWHFGWTGGYHNNIQRLAAFSHQELNIPAYWEKLKDETKFFFNDAPVVGVDISSLPDEVRSNQEKYKYLLL